MVNAGAGGELVVAKLRLGLTLLLMIVPVTNAVRAPRAHEHYVSTVIAICATMAAIGVFTVVRRDMYRPWIGFLSTIFDVTFVSAILTVFLFLGQPHTAVNSKVVFEAYFIAIAATGLRYDLRFCLLAGVLALGEYGAIVGYAATHWDLNSPVYAPYVNGMFSWASQISRLMMLAVATMLSGAVVLRAQSLRRLSTVDRMTGVFNRGYFDERLAAELSRARRHEQPLALVMLDVDHFKRFNDNHGHAAGDAGLRALSTLMRHSLRRSDLLARYGGEEFVLVMPMTNAEQACDKLESIRQAVADMPVRLPKQQTTAHITISAGISVFPDDGVTADELLDVADARLFDGKEAGRNRVTGPPVSAPPSP